jgi:uncharacterized damage-inducible protein DinB
MHPRLAEVSEYLTQQRRVLLEAANVVPDELWPSSPGPGRWSVSEILEHLYRVERGTAALLAKRIAKAREAGHAVESANGLALGEIRHTHPRLGELDLYQWILAVAEHEKRHTTQVRDVATQLAPAT